jgi:hypothetical protein
VDLLKLDAVESVQPRFGSEPEKPVGGLSGLPEEGGESLSDRPRIVVHAIEERRSVPRCLCRGTSTLNADAKEHESDCEPLPCLQNERIHVILRTPDVNSVQYLRYLGEDQSILLSVRAVSSLECSRIPRAR